MVVSAAPPIRPSRLTIPGTRRARAGGGRWTTVLGVSVALAAMVLGSFVALGSSGRAGVTASPPGSGLSPSYTAMIRISDGSITSLVTNGLKVGQLSDQITPGSMTGNTRSYTIQLSTRVSAPMVGVRLITDPVTQWGDPDQMPGGADALPPLSAWTWSIHMGKVDDTANWGPNFAPGTVGRTLTWGSYTFVVTGSIYPRATFNVALNQTNGQHATAIGYSLNGALSPATGSINDADYLKIGQGLHPSLVRFGLISSGSAIGWNALTGQPTIGWVGFDRFPAYAQSVHAKTLMDLPVGTWGDGNYLPAGMPLDRSHPVALFHPNSPTGYFPTSAAYAAYVSAVVNHVVASKETINYWSVGNEMPLMNQTIVHEYIHLFNTAEAVIHAKIPGALVGSDVMTNRTYIGDFAKNAKGVGFLSFHYYGSLGMCVVNGGYCPPQGGGMGTTNSLLMSPTLDLAHAIKFVAPHLSQIIFHNATGHWLPVIDAETNLHAAGGPAQYGTDPRTQTVLASAWLGSTLIKGTQENLASLIYYVLTGNQTIPNTFTGPIGGYGFGMTSEGTHDNDTRYAPYWALQMWSNGIPAGAPALVMTGGSPYTVEGLAFQNGSQVVVLAVNRANLTVPVSVAVSGDGVATPVSLKVFDSGSYARYVSTLHRTGGPLSPFNYSYPTGTPVSFVLHGYSLALVTLQISDRAAPPPASGAPVAQASPFSSSPNPSSTPAFAPELGAVAPVGTVVVGSAVTASVAPVNPGRSVATPQGRERLAVPRQLE